jgi:hypothetical protein
MTCSTVQPQPIGYCWYTRDPDIELGPTELATMVHPSTLAPLVQQLRHETSGDVGHDCEAWHSVCGLHGRYVLLADGQYHSGQVRQTENELSTPPPLSEPMQTLLLALDDLREADQLLESTVKEVIETTQRSARKLGRNGPCICGSGRKYKKCCLGAESA